MNSSASITIKVRNGKISLIKGNLVDNVSGCLSRFAQCIGRGFMEIYGNIDNETLCKFFSNFPCDLPSYIRDTYFLLEEYSAKVGFFIHISKNKLVFMASKNFLGLDETYGLIKSILTKIKEGQFFKLGVLSPEDVGAAISIADYLPSSNKLVLQLDRNISMLIKQAPNFLQLFNRISIYLTKESPHIMIDRPRGYMELFIGTSFDVDKYFSIFRHAISREEINTIEIAVSDSPMIEKLLSMLSPDILRYIDYLWISADAVRICKDDFSVTISLSCGSIDDNTLLGAIQQAVKYLRESRVARIKINNSGIVETTLVN